MGCDANLTDSSREDGDRPLNSSSSSQPRERPQEQEEWLEEPTQSLQAEEGPELGEAAAAQAPTFSKST